MDNKQVDVSAALRDATILFPSGFQLKGIFNLNSGHKHRKDICSLPPQPQSPLLRAPPHDVSMNPIRFAMAQRIFE